MLTSLPFQLLLVFFDSALTLERICLLKGARRELQICCLHNPSYIDLFIHLASRSHS